MKENIVVSILCITYNHEKYIRQCLDGFIMQKTDFKYEVLIHDDASTDNTAQIIREYEEKYPDIIKPIYQTENQHSKGVKIITGILAPLAKGQYIALCEGDDFWVDENKLQIQVETLKNNSNCKICLHKVKGFYETQQKEQYYPPFKLETGEIQSYNFIKMTSSYVFQTSSYFFDAETFKVYAKENPLFKQISSVGDICYLLYFANKGPIYYIDSIMSYYRRESIGSLDWGWRRLDKKQYYLKHAKKLILVYKEYDRYTNGKYHDLMQDRIFTILWRGGDFVPMLSKEFKECRKKYSFKQRLYIRLHAYFPWLMKLLKK